MADVAGVALPCRAENLFPVQLEKHRPAGLQSENARDDANVQSGILLTAEAASDERAHHMQLVLWDAEYRSQIPPGGVDGLRRTCQRQTARKRIRLRDADVRLKVTVLHHRRLVVVFDDDGRFRKRLLHVAAVECHGSEQIPPLRHRMPFMDEGRTILHGLARDRRTPAGARIPRGRARRPSGPPLPFPPRGLPPGRLRSGSSCPQ